MNMNHQHQLNSPYTHSASLKRNSSFESIYKKYQQEYNKEGTYKSMLVVPQWL